MVALGSKNLALRIPVPREMNSAAIGWSLASMTSAAVPIPNSVTAAGRAVAKPWPTAFPAVLPAAMARRVPAPKAPVNTRSGCTQGSPLAVISARMSSSALPLWRNISIAPLRLAMILSSSGRASL